MAKVIVKDPSVATGDLNQKGVGIDEQTLALAKALNIETEGKSLQEVTETVFEAQQLAAEIAKQARDAELLNLLSDYVGISDIDSLSKEEVVKHLETRKAKDAKGDEPEVALVHEGATDEVVKASNGNEYVFASDAPGAFRYLSQFRTQKEWIADKDAIDLMVAGNLKFLILKK